MTPPINTDVGVNESDAFGGAMAPPVPLVIVNVYGELAEMVSVKAGVPLIAECTVKAKVDESLPVVALMKICSLATLRPVNDRFSFTRKIVEPAGVVKETPPSGMGTVTPPTTMEEPEMGVVVTGLPLTVTSETFVVTR